MRYDEIFRIQAKAKEKTRDASLQKRPKHPESLLQRQMVHWFRLQYPQYIIAAIPNGGFRNALEAKIMKSEGVLAGFSDLIIIAEKKTLFVEVKTKQGRQSELQKRFQTSIERLGHQYCLCRSFDDFCSIVKYWLKTNQFCQQSINKY